MTNINMSSHLRPCKVPTFKNMTNHLCHNVCRIKYLLDQYQILKHQECKHQVRGDTQSQLRHRQLHAAAPCRSLQASIQKLKQKKDFKDNLRSDISNFELLNFELISLWHMWQLSNEELRHRQLRAAAPCRSLQASIQTLKKRVDKLRIGHL